MSALKSGLFYIADKKFEACDWHVTRLSLNFNLDAVQPYFISDREYRVTPERYLLINEGQSFRTLNEKSRSRMLTLAYQVGMPAQLFHTLSNTHEHLLDQHEAGHERNFFEQTFPLDDFLRSRVTHLCSASALEWSAEALDEQLENILSHIIFTQQHLHTRVTSIAKVKSSTRFEIYRRLQWAVEYGHNHFHESITTDMLASESCLSVFHFKRLFKEVYRIAPYQFIRSLRLQKAKSLLSEGMPVNQVCRSVGWEDSSSFIRLFKKEYHVTPLQFQQQPRYANRANMA